MRPFARSTVIGQADPAALVQSSVLDAMTEHAVVATDADDKIVTWNEGARRLFGFTADQMVGVRTLSDLLGPTLTGVGLVGAGSVTDPPSQRWEGVVEVTTATGATLSTQVVITPRRSADSAGAGGVVLVGRATVGNAPTDRLPGAQLVSRLGHDLRGPLGGILGLTRLLLGALAAGPVDPTMVAHRIELIRSSGERLLRTVERLMEIAGIEAAEASPRVSFDCRQVAAAVMTRTDPDQSHPPRLRTELPEHPVLVVGDPEELGRLLRELIDNAVAFTDGDEVRLRVHPAAGGYTQIDISDDGPGMPPTELTRVLTPYARNAAGPTDGGRTGLGLHVAALLADRLGAQMTASSAVGAGTTFTVRLPTAETAA